MLFASAQHSSHVIKKNSKGEAQNDMDFGEVGTSFSHVPSLG